jgi:hypothetical protein
VRLASFGPSLALAIAVGVPLDASQASPETAARYEKALKRLSSDDFQERQEASAQLAALPAEALTLVKETLKQADLELEVQVRLQDVLPKLRVKARREAAERHQAVFQAWTAKTTVEAYETAGQKDPKWDAAAREALTLMSAVWSQSKSNEPNAELRAYKLSEEAARAGCDDPLVMYVRARTYDSAVRKDYMEALRLHLHAARLMKEKGSKYPAIRQAYVFSRAAEFFARLRKETPENDQKAIRELMDLALDRLATAARDADVSDDTLIDCARAMSEPYALLTKDRKLGIDKISGVILEARPDGIVPLVFRGSLYISYAWDARGNGWANTVTPDGWKLMGERLAEAEKALTRAWEINPDDPQAPTLMLTVELGQGKGMHVMETWFKRAMETDPDNIDACRKKMYYLEPKWHGNAELMLTFGRSLLAKGNWEARLPFLLADAHRTLAGYAKDRAAYYKDEDVWKDVKAVYDGFLAGHPDSVLDRTWYAKLACWCGHYAEARTQFQALGDKVAVSVFSNPAEMEKLKAEAEEKGR